MYAIFETGGKQYTAKVGDVLFIEKLNANVDETVTFEKVLAVGDAAMTFGTPYVEGVTVSGKVLKNGKAKKITVMTYRPKKDSKRKMGHRQPYTKVEITAVGAAGRCVVVGVVGGIDEGVDEFVEIFAVEEDFVLLEDGA